MHPIVKLRNDCECSIKATLACLPLLMSLQPTSTPFLAVSDLISAMFTVTVVNLQIEISPFVGSVSHYSNITQPFDFKATHQKV